MEGVIRFVLSNFTLTFLVIGLIASGIALLRAPRPLTAPVAVEALFSWFLFFSIGVSFFYNFVMHTFFGEMSAKFIGWANSPFQLEVGFASLGFAVVGLLAFRGSLDLRLAAVVGPALFLLGAAGGHLPDARHRQFCPRKCWNNFLHRHPDSRLRLPPAVVSAPVRATRPQNRLLTILSNDLTNRGALFHQAPAIRNPLPRD